MLAEEEGLRIRSVSAPQVLPQLAFTIQPRKKTLPRDKQQIL